MELDLQTIFRELHEIGIDYLVVGGAGRKQDLADVEHLRMVLER